MRVTVDTILRDSLAQGSLSVTGYHQNSHSTIRVVFFQQVRCRELRPTSMATDVPAKAQPIICKKKRLVPMHLFPLERCKQEHWLLMNSLLNHVAKCVLHSSGDRWSSRVMLPSARVTYLSKHMLWNLCCLMLGRR